jgi:hypothetical protein
MQYKLGNRVSSQNVKPQMSKVTVDEPFNNKWSILFSIKKHLNDYLYFNIFKIKLKINILSPKKLDLRMYSF